MRAHHFFYARAGEPKGCGLRLGLAKRIRLRLAPPLSHRLGKVGKQHGKPEPERDLKVKREMAVSMPLGSEQQHRRENAAHFHDKHDRVAHHARGIQFQQRVECGAARDWAVQ